MPKSNLLPLIADRLLNTPLLIDPSKAQVIYDVLEGRVGGDIIVEADDGDQPQIEASGFVGTRFTKDGKFSYARRADGVAIVDVRGSLVNRGAWIGASSGLMSYEGIAAQIDAAMSDGEVSALILDLDSPGGEATGMFNLAAKVRQAADQMPVVAVVNDMAASAAYAIASAADEIVVSPTSITGSIGVVLVHMDRSGELKKKGVKPTLFQKGDKKTYGHPFGPVTTEAALSIDVMMETMYGRFLETVEMGRGDRLTADAARATEAGTFVGAQAIEAGIADRVGTFDEVLAELQSNARSGKTKRKLKMADKSTEDKPAGTFTQAQLDQATADGRAAGAKEAVARIGAIVNSDEAKGREATALSMALDLDMASVPAASVINTLGTLPKTEAQTAAPKTPLPGQRAEGEAEMGADDGRMPDAPQADDGWKDAVAEYNARV